MLFRSHTRWRGRVLRPDHERHHGIHGHRIMGAAQPDEVLVSNTVKELVAGSGIIFRDRGTHSFKGLPGEWRLFTPDVHEAEAVTP